MTEETYNLLMVFLRREVRNIDLGIAQDKERERRKERLQKAMDEIILLRHRPS